MKQKESAGLAIIYRGMVLLAHTTGRKWWGSYGIPKGGIEPGESRMDAAIRETREEVGLDIPRSMIDPNPRTYVLTSRKYKYTKTVYWYAAQVEDLGQIGMKSLVVPKSQLQLEEVDWAGFMPLAEAKKRAMSSQQQLLTQLVGLGLLESHRSVEIYKPEHQKPLSSMKHVKLFEQFINEANADYEYKEDSGHGKPTMILRLGPAAWKKVSHLFDDAGRPKDTLKKIPYNKTVWNLHASGPYNRTTADGTEEAHKIYGVSGDFTFGNAPTFYQQKYRGNKKAAKYIYDWFIKKYLS